MIRKPPSGLRRRLIVGAVAGCLIAVPVVLLALAVRSEWAPVRRLDHSVAGGLNRLVAEQPWLVPPLHAIAEIFHPWVFRLTIAALVAVLAWRGAPRLAWWAGVTMAASTLLGPLIQLPLSRARPVFDDPVVSLPGYSFPSLHALNSAVGTLVLLLVLLPALPGPRVRVAAWCVGALVILLVGFDRIALGAHYLSDVLAGWLAAAAIVVATVTAFAMWRREAGRPPPEHGPLAGVDPDEARNLS